MNTLLNKTHLFFFLIIPLILAVSFYKPKGTFDINIKDTYFVIRHPHLGILLSIFYLILGTIYFCLLKKGIQLSNWIVYIHTILSIGGLILIWLLLKKNFHPSANFEETLRVMKFEKYFTYITVTTFFCILLSQIVFLIGIIIKLIKA